MPDFHALIDSWNSPPTRHAMFVHMPIALAIVGCVLALVSAVLPRNKTARFLAMGCQAAVVLAAYFTVQTGDRAFDAVAAKGIRTPEVSALIDLHQDMAEQIWIFGAGCLALLGVAAATKNAASMIFGWLAVAGTLATIGWVGLTANHGGELVYHYGVGTPQPVACYDIPGTRSDGRDHAAEHAVTATAPSATMAGSPSAGSQPSASQPGQPNPPTTSASPSTSAPPANDQAAADPVKVAFFREKVYPILSENCFTCHNPNRARRSGGLDQSTRETILKGGRSGPAITPGKPDESLLVHRIRGDIPDKRIMPPSGQLADDQIAIIAQWVQDGAVWAESRE